MSQQNCPFCQLSSNPGQLLIVGETDNFYAWLEVNPRAKGHSMIVPKEHKENVLEFSLDEWQEAMKLTREVVEKAKKGLGADGASITVNIEEAGGQMLPHAYIQVFPRFEDDENAGTPTGAIFPQREELKQQLQDIQKDMSGVKVDLGESKAKKAHKESQKFKDESEIDRMLDKQKIEKKAKKKEEQKAKERENKEEDSPEDPKPEKVKTVEKDLSSSEMFDKLVKKYGGREALLKSDEFRQLLAETDYDLEKKRSLDREKSFEWR